jgi:putative ABC transport system permease protein
MSLAAAWAAARIARRQARRSPGRSALVIAMVALPITALVGASVVIRTAEMTPDDRATDYLGSADVAIDVDGAEGARPGEVLGDLPQGTALAERRFLDSTTVLRGSLLYLPVEVFSVPIDRRPARGIFTVLEGRAPVEPGEVAVDPETLESFAVNIGERLELDDIGLSLRVTGTIVRRGSIQEWVAVVGPGTLAGRRDDWPVQLLVDLPPGADVAGFLRTLRRSGGTEGFTSRTDYGQDGPGEAVAATAVSFALTATALFGTGLIAAAAFAVGARRQLRTLGLVGAAGAEPRHVRGIVLCGGVGLGLTGSLLGAALGMVGAVLAHPHLGRFIGRDPGPIEIPLAAVAGAVALGTVAATLAAWGPARSAARLSTVDALAGRTPPPRPPGRLAGLGVVAVLAGAAATGWATLRDADAVLTGGMLAMLAGFLVAIPLLVTWVGRIAGYLPTAPRLGAREIARHGRRTGAALAAGTMALALPVAVATLTLSDEAHERRIPFMAPDHLMASAYTPDGGRAGAAAFLADLRAAFPDSLVVPLRPAVYEVDPDAGGGSDELPAWVEGPRIETPEGIAYRESGGLLVGGPALLRALHAEEGIPALANGSIVGIGPGTADRGTILLFREPDEEGREEVVALRAVEAGEVRYASIGPGGEYTYVVSPRAAARLSLRASRWPDGFPQFLLRATGPIDDTMLERARAVAAEHPGGYITSIEDLGSHAGVLRLTLNVLGAAMALAIVAVIVALAAAEARRDQAILVAVGAGPGRRRRVAGARAFLLASLAGLLAVPAGFLPMAVIQASKDGGRPIVTPWIAIAVVTVLVPLVAGAVGAIGSRNPKAVQLLHPVA